MTTRSDYNRQRSVWRDNSNRKSQSPETNDEDRTSISPSTPFGNILPISHRADLDSLRRACQKHSSQVKDGARAASLDLSCFNFGPRETRSQE
jgi:hypothetical protein